jgi:glucan phosphorylase
LAITRAGNLFTTHTAVADGFDCFAPALIEQYLGGYAEQHYLPAALAYRDHSANKSTVGRQMVNWRQAQEQHRPTLRFGEAKVQTKNKHHICEVQVSMT